MQKSHHMPTHSTSSIVLSLGTTDLDFLESLVICERPVRLQSLVIAAHVAFNNSNQTQTQKPRAAADFMVLCGMCAHIAGLSIQHKLSGFVVAAGRGWAHGCLTHVAQLDCEQEGVAPNQGQHHAEFPAYAYTFHIIYYVVAWHH